MIGQKVKLDISKNAKIVIKDGATLRIGILDHPLVNEGSVSVKLTILGDGKLIVDGDSIISKDCCIFIDKGAVLEMDGFILNGANRVHCRQEIHIGKDSTASWGVEIMDNDGHAIFFDPNDPNPLIKTAPVHIGNKCWIGQNCIILKGVVIGDGSIIGAGSVVTRDIGQNTIVVGNPIREIRSNVYWKL
jgi:acetyltransferase-like isoleucine patch superfamily enzyme